MPSKITFQTINGVRYDTRIPKKTITAIDKKIQAGNTTSQTPGFNRQKITHTTFGEAISGSSFIGFPFPYRDYRYTDQSGTKGTINLPNIYGGTVAAYMGRVPLKDFGIDTEISDKEYAQYLRLNAPKSVRTEIQQTILALGKNNTGLLSCILCSDRIDGEGNYSLPRLYSISNNPFDTNPTLVPKELGRKITLKDLRTEVSTIENLREFQNDVLLFIDKNGLRFEKKPS